MHGSNMLAQISGRTTGPAYSGQTSASELPKPRTRGEVVGYAILGVLLLVVIFAFVIKFSRRDG